MKRVPSVGASERPLRHALTRDPERARHPGSAHHDPCREHEQPGSGAPRRSLRAPHSSGLHHYRSRANRPALDSLFCRPARYEPCERRSYAISCGSRAPLTSTHRPPATQDLELLELERGGIAGGEAPSPIMRVTPPSNRHLPAHDTGDRWAVEKPRSRSIASALRFSFGADGQSGRVELSGVETAHVRP
jgi:hypothetical protein